MDPGEQFEDTILREVVEETGLVTQLTGLAGSVKSESPLFNVVNVIMTGKPESLSVCLSPEHQDFRWFHPHEIQALSMVDHLKKLTLDHFGISDG